MMIQRKSTRLIIYVNEMNLPEPGTQFGDWVLVEYTLRNEVNFGQTRTELDCRFVLVGDLRMGDPRPITVPITDGKPEIGP